MKMTKTAAALLLSVSLLIPTLLPSCAARDAVEIVEYDGAKICVVSAGTKVSQLLGLVDDPDASVTGAGQGTLGDNAALKTGDTLRYVSQTGGYENVDVAALGDVNGDGEVTASDARLALRAAVKLENPTGCFRRAADMDGDGAVTAYDARSALRTALRLGVMTVDEYLSADASIKERERLESISESESRRIAEEESKKRAAEEESSRKKAEEESRRLAARFDQPIPAGERVPDSYFDDAVFIGDSVSLSLYYYCRDNGGLGNARFLVAGSLSAMNALFSTSSQYSRHPTLNGVKVRVEDGVKQLGAKKVYIMLGMNDVGMGVENAVSNYTELIGLILDKSPDAKIIVQSMTPLANGSTSNGKNLNNDNIRRFNDRMRETCKANKWYFLDVASALTDADGYLPRSYCSDYPNMGLHLTYSADKVWIDYIRSHPLPE